MRQLEQENSEYSDLLARGALIRRTVADAEKDELTAILADERRQRADIEKEKKRIEQELESLTTALFEEANKVIDPDPNPSRILHPTTNAIRW